MKSLVTISIAADVEFAMAHVAFERFGRSVHGPQMNLHVTVLSKRFRAFGTKERFRSVHEFDVTTHAGVVVEKPVAMFAFDKRSGGNRLSRCCRIGNGVIAESFIVIIIVVFLVIVVIVVTVSVDIVFTEMTPI